VAGGLDPAVQSRPGHLNGHRHGRLAERCPAGEPGQLPRHVGIILDGNRRWARQHDFADVSIGHNIGFAKIPNVLSWCDEIGLRIVTLWMLSDDNIQRRAPPELNALYAIDEGVALRLAADRRFKLHVVGGLGLLPARLADKLRAAEDATCDVDGMLVNLCVGYGGRQELLDAVRALVREIAATGDPAVTAERLAGHLATAGQPDPDLIIRPSGECRTSGFMLWQAAFAELYFCDCLWPDFSKAHLLDAIHAYRRRQRRYGA
jgi:short-chain Z-isoprenyl diphosphate synthase